MYRVISDLSNYATKSDLTLSRMGEVQKDSPPPPPPPHTHTPTPPSSFSTLTSTNVVINPQKLL